MPDGEGVKGSNSGVEESGRADVPDQPSSALSTVTDLAPSGKPSGAVRRRRKKDMSPMRQASDPLWKILDSKIGGRDGLLASALASSNPKAAELTAMLLDKAYRRHGTKILAQKAGLSASEVVDMFRDRKWLEAALTLHEQLPAIVADAAEDARASMVPCSECKAQPQTPPCYVCKGKGEVRRPGDKDKLKFVGEATGMVKRDQPSMQTNVQVNVSGGASFEDLMKRATLQTTKRVEVIDVEE